MTNRSLSVLFVDDEPKILDGLRRQLHEHRERWRMRFASDGLEALNALAGEPADVVVSDMRMPRISGGELLKRVHEFYPQTTRMIFTGQTDTVGLFPNLGSVHHFLQKPCEPSMLCRAIERTHELGVRLNSPRMQLAVNRITALPPGGENYRALRIELSREPADIGKIATLVARDPALTVKVLQLVSSAFFGLPRRVNDPHTAVVLLGINMLQAIVVAGHVFDFLGKGECNEESVSQIWKSSILTGEVAARYAQQAQASRETQQLARLAGMLSLIGRAVLLRSEAASYGEVMSLAARKETTLAAAEMSVFGATYADVGAYALGQWGLPDPIVNAVAAQEAPGALARTANQDACNFVHLARWTIGGPPRTLDEKPELDHALLSRASLGALIDPRRKCA